MQYKKMFEKKVDPKGRSRFRCARGLVVSLPKKTLVLVLTTSADAEQIRNSRRDIGKGERGTLNLDGCIDCSFLCCKGRTRQNGNVKYLPADLQREMFALKREEQKLILDIKKAAKQNNMQAAKVLAKSLVRLRGQMNQLRASEAQLRGVKTTITVRPSSLLLHVSLSSRCSV